MSGMWSRGVSSQSINTYAPHFPPDYAMHKEFGILTDYYFPTMPFITIVAAQLSELQEDKSLSVSEAVVNRRGRRGEGWERGEGKTLQQTDHNKGDRERAGL